MQSMAFDNVNRRLFIVQPCNGDLDDLCVNQVSFTGTVEGHMRLPTQDTECPSASSPSAAVLHLDGVRQGGNG